MATNSANTQKLLEGPPDDTGEMWKQKSALMLADVVEAAYPDLINSETGLGVRLEWAKQLAKWADLEPKPTQVQPGQGFKINIIMPEGTGNGLTIEGVVEHLMEGQEEADQTQTLALPSLRGLPIKDQPDPDDQTDDDYDPADEPTPLKAQETEPHEIEGTPPEVKAFRVPDFDLKTIFQ